MNAEKGFMVVMVTQRVTIQKGHTVVPANQDFMVTEKTAALVRNNVYRLASKV
jgi:hypothetical protein